MTITQEYQGWSKGEGNGNDGHYPVPKNNWAKNTSKVASEFMSDLAFILFDSNMAWAIYLEDGKYLGTFCIQTSSYWPQSFFADKGDCDLFISQWANIDTS